MMRTYSQKIQQKCYQENRTNSSWRKSWKPKKFMGTKGKKGFEEVWKKIWARTDKDKPITSANSGKGMVNLNNLYFRL